MNVILSKKFKNLPEEVQENEELLKQCVIMIIQ